MNRSLIVASLLVASFLLASSIALVPYFSGNNVVFAQGKDQGKVKHVTLIASEKEVQVAPDNALHPGGVTYNAMVFNGTIPGPVISIDQGDTLNITLKNEGQTIHSMDFHAGFGPDKANSGSVKPGESKTWTLKGVNPGVFFYHCSGDSLNGIWEHIANGMYGGIVVHPQTEEKAKEFYLVFGELYNNADKGVFVGTNGTGSFDVGKLLSDQPDLVLTNGMAHKYVPAVGQVNKLVINKDAELFKVKPGELTRWYVVNAGPNDGVSFHIISGMINVRDGSNTANNALGTQDRNDETWWIPPGSASVIESTFPDPGIYVGVDHSMKDVVKGAAFAIVAMENSTATDHPTGTCVAQKGSESVVCTEQSASASGSESKSGSQSGSQSKSGSEDSQNASESKSGSQSEITQNATMLNTSSSSNMTGNGTMMTGNMSGNATTGGNQTASPGSTVIISPGSSTPSNAKFFDPPTLKVAKGTTVTWKNGDSTLHTVTSGTAEGNESGTSFDSSYLAGGKTFQWTFSTPGTFDYYCTLHPYMKGQIVVS
jgi:nitrite reductase (NO-forming)